MSKILDLYKSSQKDLGVDKISFTAFENAKTPYTTNDLKKADDAFNDAVTFDNVVNLPSYEAVTDANVVNLPSTEAV